VSFKVGDRVSWYYTLEDKVLVGTVLEISHDGYTYSIREDSTKDKFHIHREHIRPESDRVNNPSHYQHPSGIEVIDITRHESFLRGNVLKYVLRAPYKNNELEDLKKAAKYLAWEIERVENDAEAR
jgi:uncharacterized protein DUF3310